ncbi:MAG: AMIN domain-containing protein [Myxococcota bacterium]
MHRAAPLSLFVVLALGLSGPVRADRYKGVTPGSEEEPPRSKRARKSRVHLMTWPGFQMRSGGGSRVFVQTSREPEFETERKSGRFVVVLEKTRVHLRNNRRTLETRYFNTPVTRVKVKKRGEDLAIVLELRAEVRPKVTTKADPKGPFHYVIVDLPAGQWIEDAAPADEEGPRQAPAREPRSDDEGQARDREKPPSVR